MRVRLSANCEFDKMTVSVNGMVIIVGKEWTHIPNEQFLRNEMEIEGQPKQETKIEQPIVISKEIEKPIISIKPKKK